MVVHVPGSVEDERFFPSLSFLKNKLSNSLDQHLPLGVGWNNPYIGSLEAGLQSSNKEPMYGLVHPPPSTSSSMYYQKFFTLEHFPYDNTFDMWMASVEPMRYGVY